MSMWQEILAVDSRISALRGNQNMAQDKDLRSLYLKRRLQLLQGEQSDTEMETGQVGPVRNKRYLSLRVKLLKGQFGLPSDVLSLKSLSIEGNKTRNSRHAVDPDVANENEVLTKMRNRMEERFAFCGVHHIFDQNPSPVTRITHSHMPGNSFIACAASSSGISLCDLQTSETTFLKTTKGRNQAVDIDLSDSDEIAVSSDMEGVLTLWDIRHGSQLRQIDITFPGVMIKFCRFLPQNNNFVICVLSSGFVNIMNVSTGKFVMEGQGSPVLGNSLCCLVNPQGTVLWVGNDRGQIESFKLDCEHGVRIHKGCRMSVPNERGKPIMSLSYRNNSGLQSGRPCLMASQRESKALSFFVVSDDFGTLALITTLQLSGTVTTATFAPSMASSGGIGIAAGTVDGSLLFYDLEKSGCLNKLLGHSKSVLSVAFSPDERFVISSDASGQIIVWKK